MATPVREFSYGAVEIYNQETLGVGSYGKVCKAKCGQLPAAFKLLHNTMFDNNDPGIQQFVQRFQQEIQFLRMIKHPNIVQFLETSRDPQSGRLGLLMELMDESLTRFLERSTGPLPYHIQLNIGQDIALALAYLHLNDIIHRDLSSNNVLLIGEGTRAKVTDFGMSRMIDMNPRMTPLTMCPGTVAYMPPEALITPPHYSSKLDCFTHGVLTIQIATRQFPNPGDAHRLAHRNYIEAIPETERRGQHIDQVEPGHPLLPLALCCLRDRDTERPSADELCGRLASLKSEPMYRHSLEQSRQQNILLQQQIQEKDGELARVEEELQMCRAELQAHSEEHQEQLQACRYSYEEAIQAQSEEFQACSEELQERNIELQACSMALQACSEELQERNEELQACSDELQDRNEELEACSNELQAYSKELQERNEELQACSTELQARNEQLQACSTELQGCNEQLQACSMELQARNEELQACREELQERSEALQISSMELQESNDESPPIWRQGQPAPVDMESEMGAAVVHNNTAYFSHCKDVYSYTIPEDKWNQLIPCSYEKFSIAVVNHKLTTIGGWGNGGWWGSGAATNTLLSFSLSVPAEWTKLLPPMPTKRVRPAAVTTPTHLIVAGGCELPTVEVLNLELHTPQWMSARSSPKALECPSMTLCGEHVYLSGDYTLFSCSINKLVESCNSTSTNSSAGDSVWTRLPDTPTYHTTLATLRGCVLTIGGSDEYDGGTPTGAIHCYDRSTNSWRRSVIGEMSGPRYRTLVAVLPSNELMVVGGRDGAYSLCRSTEIACP